MYIYENSEPWPGFPETILQSKLGLSLRCYSHFGCSSERKLKSKFEIFLGEILSLVTVSTDPYKLKVKELSSFFFLQKF